MKKSNILEIGNFEKAIRILTDHISTSEIDILKNEKVKHVNLLLSLAQSHLKYAKSFNGKDSWRQIVSRSYYSCYCASRAIRFFHESEYNQSSDDHKKIGNLPKDFINHEIWKNFLNAFRGDRNIADYDHYAKKTDLENTPTKYIQESEIFLNYVKKYIKDKS